MRISANTQAMLLLTTHFPKAQRGAAVPLTPGEWGRFAEWLASCSMTPENLLKEDPSRLLQGWQDKTLSTGRVKMLLDRGATLSLSMEKWLRGGLWVMTRYDSDYPVRLKRHLGGDSPAVLFGCGNRVLLNSGGIAVVGSRNACERDLDYSRKLGALVSQSGRSIVSGGARGVDESAMLGALENEGTAVGVMANDLLRTCTSVKYRRYLSDNNLVLISPFNPEAGFNAGHAMQRNKYIYCLADFAWVVHSGRSGGTWNGAMENLAKKWVPLFVKETDDREAANPALISRGATLAPARTSDIDIERLLESCNGLPTVNTDLFSHYSAVTEKPTAGTSDKMADVETRTVKSIIASGEKTPGRRPEETIPGNVGDDHTPSVDLFYRFFLNQIQRQCSKEPQTPDDLARHFQIAKTQVNTWLKRATSEGQVKKLSRPVRYQTLH